jgi:hypothetical protein
MLPSSGLYETGRPTKGAYDALLVLSNVLTTMVDFSNSNQIHMAYIYRKPSWNIIMTDMHAAIPLLTNGITNICIILASANRKDVRSLQISMTEIYPPIARLTKLTNSSKILFMWRSPGILCSADIHARYKSLQPPTLPIEDVGEPNVVRQMSHIRKAEGAESDEAAQGE